MNSTSSHFIPYSSSISTCSSAKWNCITQCKRYTRDTSFHWKPRKAKNRPTANRIRARVSSIFLSFIFLNPTPQTDKMWTVPMDNWEILGTFLITVDLNYDVRFRLAVRVVSSCRFFLIISLTWQEFLRATPSVSGSIGIAKVVPYVRAWHESNELIA